MMRLQSEPELGSAMRTDPGQRRPVNEDWGIAEYPCFLVADGMGGHDAGDEASRAAIEAFIATVRQGEPSSVREVALAIDAARRAVEEIAAVSERGAGCTLTGAILVTHERRPHWLVINIGDSRVYLHRGAALQQLTTDHSLREEMIASGEQDETRLPGRNVITRALGSIDSTADSWLLPVEEGSRLLICSDGLTTELDDEQLRATLTMGGGAAAVVDELVARANESGGRDNVTVVVVDVLVGGESWHLGAPWGDDATDDATLTATLPRRVLQ
ncbi:PP2C family protein-serine/threonine phosphatase [Leucobacter triazinivorans]|nr:protein phosphatase 2C domain-containing protein [Leucobacter triazinivorans]